MHSPLAEPINTYFAACNNADIARVTDCLMQNATVLDEGGSYQGRADIQSWFLETQKKYSYSVNPINASRDDERTIVLAEVAGNFPGSPIQIHYSFLLKENKIQRLEIY